MLQNRFPYTDTNKRYYTLDYFYRQKFSQKVAKISLNAGFTCPNKDGTKGFGGCIYCSKSGSGDFAGKKEDSLVEQFEKIRKQMGKKWKDTLYIGYFQANSNTYAKVEVLRQKYEPILQLDNVVGLSIATRPDAISEECLDYLEELHQRTFLTVELGLQTIHETTAKLIHRGHSLSCFEEMVKKLRARNINVIVHIINGLPYETKEMMCDTVRYLNKLDIQGIKIHMLHILKETPLATLYEKKPFPVLSKEEYVDLVCDQVELLRQEIVLHRITGDPKQEDLIEPKWLTKKFDVLNSIDKELERRHTFQGFQNSILNRVRERLDFYIKPNALVIDATVGNGNDTLLLAQNTPHGHVYGFDIQKIAIERTKERIQKFDNVTLFPISHSKMKETLPEFLGKISIVLFNLGYLPKGDRKITTKVNTTIAAVEQSLEMIHDHGVVLITVYPGHEEGKEESKKLQNFLKDKSVTYYHNDTNPISPYLIELRK